MEEREEFVEELYCPICGDLFEEPLMLYCTHSFCRDCLHERIKKGHVTRKSASCLMFDCPVCRKTVTLDEHGLDGLPKNRLLHKMVDTYRGHQSSRARPPDERGLGRCTEHTKRDLGAFCNKCHMIVCIDCVVGKHKQHDIEAVEDVFNKKRKVLQHKVADTEEELKMLERAEAEEIKYFEQIKTQCSEKCDAIKYQFDEYTLLLERCRDSFLSEVVGREHQELAGVQGTLDHIHTQQARLADILDTLKQRLDLDMAALLKEPKDENSENTRARKGKGRPHKEMEEGLKSPRTACFSDCRLVIDSGGLETIINSAQLIWEQESDDYSSKHMADRFTVLFEKDWKSVLAESTARNKDDNVTQLLSILMETYQQAETNCESHLESLAFHLLQPNIDTQLNNCNVQGINKTDEEQCRDTAVFCGVKESLRKLRALNTPTLMHDTVFTVHRDTEQLSSSTGNSYQRQLSLFASKCLETCFMLLLQDPPLYIDTYMDRDLAAETDTDNYNFIKRKGRKSKIVAWPPLLLYKGGPVIAKGVVFMPTTTTA